MDPISMAAGAIPMLTGLLDKGMDLAKGAMDLANTVMKQVGDGDKVGGEEQKPQGQIEF